MRSGERVLGGEAEIAHAAALGEHHDRLRVDLGEGDVGDGVASAGARDRLWRAEEIGQEELAAHARRSDIAILAEAHRPDRVALVVAGGGIVGIAEALAAPHRIEQAHLATCRIAPDAHAPYAPAEIGEVPAGRRARKVAIWAILEVGARRGIEGDCGKCGICPRRRVEEVCSARRAVIVMAQIPAVGSAQAVDHAGLEIGHEELLVPPVEGDVPESGARVGAAIQGYLREDRRLVAVSAIELPHGSGPSARAPHACHPVRVAVVPMETEGRSCSDVDIGRRGVVERDAEDLADLSRGDGRALRGVEPLRALRRGARVAQVEDAANGAVEVDGRFAPLVGRAGETRHEGLTRLERVFGECRGTWRDERANEEQQYGTEARRRPAHWIARTREAAQSSHNYTASAWRQPWASAWVTMIVVVRYFTWAWSRAGRRSGRKHLHQLSPRRRRWLHPGVVQPARAGLSV